MEELDSTWKETERRVRNDGFREGAGKGNEEKFQIGFDDGFAEGILMGQSLGYLKAIEKYSDVLGAPSLSLEAKALLTEPKLGDCLICKEIGVASKAALPDSVYEKPYNDIKSSQKRHNEEKTFKIEKVLQQR